MQMELLAKLNTTYKTGEIVRRANLGDWAGAGCWGRSLVQNYVRMNMTSTISWRATTCIYGIR